jgi:serine/threonine-protein kinase
MSSFFNELKRRNVTRVGVMYLVFSWVLIQLSDIIFPMFSIPEWGGRLVVIMLAMGFPLALIFAWVFELTPEGVKLEKNIDRTQSVTHTTARKLDVITIILLVFALVVLGASNVANHDGEPRGDKEAPVESGTGADPAPQSIAVLPFVNMSDDPANEYFSDGLAEELLNDLARIDALRVAGRTSSFAFKGKDQDLRVIGEKLNVKNILEGSVRKVGNRVRITAQLINVNDGYHLWSGTYERELDDIFAIQQEISSAIVKALKITLSVDEQVDAHDKGTTNAEAYSNYLRGLFFWNRRTVPDFMKAEEYLGKALGLDPDYAQAHAMLAMTYALIPDYDGGTKADWYPRAQQAIDMALRLNPDLAEAYVARAHLREDWRHDWLGAEQDFKRAIELNPRYATAHQWYGNLLQLLRRDDEHLEQFRIAVELDSMSPIILNNYGYALYLSRQYEEALAVTQQSIEVLPDASFNYGQIAFVLVALERWDEAEAAFRRSAELDGRSPEIYVRFVAAMQDKALTSQAIEMIMTDTEWPHDVFLQPWFLIKLGAHEEAISLIEQFVDEDLAGMGYLNLSDFDPVRNDPRIQAILKRLNLAGT